MNRQTLFDKTARGKQDRVVDDVSGQISEIARTEFRFPTRLRTRDAHPDQRMVRPANPLRTRSSGFRKPEPLALPRIGWKFHAMRVPAGECSPVDLMPCDIQACDTAA